MTFASAQQTWTCPSSGSSVCYCNVYVNVPGFKLDCGGRYGPEQIKSQIEFYSSYGPIHTLIISSIEQSSFSYVPDNFLAGVQISDVTFKCFHYNSVNSGLLSFSAYAFTDETGTCGLTGNLTITDCNIRQFYSADLNNCNQLTKLAFVNSHVESIIDIPTLSSLKNFTVYYPLIWNGASQRGLSRLTLASGATLPRLRYLDLTGNSLTDESIQFIPQLTAIEEMHLEGNKFSVVPTLTASFDLHTISMTLSSNSSVSIQLPNPRTQTRSLNASFYSGNGAANEVDFLDGTIQSFTNSISLVMVFDILSLLERTGMFVDDVIHLKLIMTEFKESVFLAPLQTNGVTIDLNPSNNITKEK